MRSRGPIAWVIVIVWAATYIRKVIDPSFPVPAEITPVMLAAAGYLFGKDIKDRILNGKKEQVDED